MKVTLDLDVLLMGILLNQANLTQWRPLANICILIGALMAGGGLIVGRKRQPR